MSSHFCCCQKCPNHFWKLRNNARLIIHIFMYFSHLYLIQKNSKSFLFYVKWKRIEQQVFFQFPVADPAHLGLGLLLGLEPTREGVSGARHVRSICIRRPPCRLLGTLE